MKSQLLKRVRELSLKFKWPKLPDGLCWADLIEGIRLPRELDIPVMEWPDERQFAESILRLTQNHQSAGHETGSLSSSKNATKNLAVVATNAWKAKGRMTDRETGEVREEMKRVYRNIESISDALSELAIEVKDHTGDAFDYGLPLKVIATEPKAGISKESVLETVKPSVYWQGQLIQMGEVIIATPT